ncbi:hypothetical protein [Bradyrhizobium sp. S3.9.1]|uniref:hypothetical protein n=1 Tax=Bradyrhizobium sp. S3.9.1 TaxID=3156431 RepID=UPI00339120B8
MSYHTTTSSAVLSPGVAQQVVGPNSNRYELTLQVTGANPVTFGFGSAPSAPGKGLTLAGASAAGGQGGARVWAQNARQQPEDYYAIKNKGDAVPRQSIWALSAAASTVVVIESLP